MASLKLRLLGDFELIYNGARIQLIQARPQALLAYLVLFRDKDHPRKQLAYTFWPDKTDERAHANLRKAIHHLRQILPNADHFIKIEHATIQWTEDKQFSLDVAQFEERLSSAAAAEHKEAISLIQSALEAYSGDLFPGCYDDWIISERDRLHQKYLDALDKLILLLEQQRDYEQAVQVTRRLLQFDPINERAYRHLMRLHASNGDHARAKQAYQECTTMLRAELDARPSPETEALYNRLLATTTLDERKRTDSQLTPNEEETDYPLVGRSDEWKQLQDCWQKAGQNGVHFAFVSGEAGIGKTRLVEELMSWSRLHGIATAYTRSYEAEGRLAYAPVSGWLRSEPLHDSLPRLDDAWLIETARLLPDLLTDRPDLSQPQPLTESWQRQQLFTGLSHAILSSNQPLLLLIDDLQWCDHETLAWFHFLLRSATDRKTYPYPGTRLLLVGTARPEEIETDHSFITLRLSLQQDDLITTIPVGNLDRSEIELLAESVIGHEPTNEQVETIINDSAGNPLFIVEMARSVDTINVEKKPLSEGEKSRFLPAKIQALIQSRLHRLSPYAQELISLIAVIGRDFSYDLLMHASDADERDVASALDELYSRGIIRAHSTNRYDFAHDRIRDVVYQDLSGTRRIFLHRRMAMVFESQKNMPLPDIHRQLATHYDLGGLPAEAAQNYILAAEDAYDLWAMELVIAYVDKGLALLPKQPTSIDQQLNALALKGAALVATTGYSHQDVLAVYQQAVALKESTLQWQSEAYLYDGLWVCHLVRGEYQPALELAKLMLARAETAHSKQFLEFAHHAMGVTLYYSGEVAQAHKHLTLSGENHEKPRRYEKSFLDIQEPVVVNLIHLSFANWSLGYMDSAVQRCQEALELANQSGSPLASVTILTQASILYCYLHDPKKVLELTSEAATIASTKGMLYWQMIAQILSGWAAVTLHQTEGQTSAMQDTLSLLLTFEAKAYRSFFLTLLADALRKTGQISKAVAILDEAQTHADQTGEYHWLPEILRLRGEVLLETSTHELRNAEDNFQRAITLARRQKAKVLELRSSVSLAQIWQQPDKSDDARLLLSEIVEQFTEGFETPDLQRARSLLTQLS